ncbi:MAG: flagellar basal body P-ring protein FlgI [Alphaproteobacteria bacterium]|jgi:flagellar P-ring protein precursor FlgI
MLRFLSIGALILSFLPFVANASSKTRVKDIINVEGVRDNLLVGYGLVVGLNGTGDKLNNSPFTEKSMQAFLTNLGLNTSDKSLKSKNVAAVTVTATLPAFSRNGSKIDINVSTMGDATSLQGGTLIATPLLGADGQIYAVAQGQVSTGGFKEIGKSGSSFSKGVNTNSHIANGAIVEREIDFKLNELTSLNISLKNPDIGTATRLAFVVNDFYDQQVAEVLDPGTIKITPPESYTGFMSLFLSEVEQLKVVPDQVARVIIDESSGTIVMNENVRLDTVAIAQGNLVVTIDETPQVSQALPLAPEGAQTAVTPKSKIQVDEGRGSKMSVVKENANLKDLVDGLNSLGVGPRDLITILQSIRSAGALHAEIEAR